MELQLADQAKAIIIAYEKGYRIKNKEVVSPFRKKPLKQRINSSGYLSFSVSTNLNNRMHTIPVHRLLAYQKYGKHYFSPGIVARHRNNNKINNSFRNVIIGTESENMMDKPPAQRRTLAANAAKHLRRFTDKEIFKIRIFHIKYKSYKKTMAEFHISSKGSLNYILNHHYQSSI